MKILVIGCKGFIGSHTYDHFARTGHEVYGCDVLVEYNDAHYTEQICREFHSYFGVATSSLRIFSAFGPGLRKQLFWDWFRKVKRSNEVELYGTGLESRDFIFIEDVCHAVECVVAAAPFRSECINVGNGVEISIRKAMEVFKEESGLDFIYKFNNEVRTGDPINWQADIGLLQSFGYVGKYSFKEGIRSYLAWVKDKQ